MALLTRTRFLAGLVAIALAGTLSAPAAEAPTVFAAASLKNALDEIAGLFAKEGKPAPKVSYAASNTLAKQIEQGAPADLFFSADLDWMDYLAKKDLIQLGTRVNLLANSLVLIAPKDAKAEVTWGRVSISHRRSAPASSPWAMSMRCRPASTARRRWRSSAAGRL